jgi:hypothetical protein
MEKKFNQQLNAVLGSVLLALTACGGGGGDSNASTGGASSGTPGVGTPGSGSTTPPPSASPTTNSAVGCYDFDAAFNTNSTSKLSYQRQTTLPLTTLVENSVWESSPGIEVVLGGQSMLRSNTKITVVKAATGVAEVSLSSIWLKRTGAAQTTIFQTEDATPTDAAGVSTAATRVSRISYNPPLVDNTASLAIGQSLERHSQAVLSFSPPIVGSQGSLDFTQSVKFAAIENLTVPAGTYETCRFEYVDINPAGSTSTVWILRGKGSLIKSVGISPVGNNQTATSTTVATSVEVNGKKL